MRSLMLQSCVQSKFFSVETMLKHGITRPIYSRSWDKPFIINVFTLLKNNLLHLCAMLDWNLSVNMRNKRARAALDGISWGMRYPFPSTFIYFNEGRFEMHGDASLSNPLAAEGLSSQVCYMWFCMPNRKI